MNVEIKIEAAQFREKDFINGIFFSCSVLEGKKGEEKSKRLCRHRRGDTDDYRGATPLPPPPIFPSWFVEM